MKRTVLAQTWRRAVPLTTVLLVLSLLAGIALASNMGFKLNYGVVNAINKLLAGSGISVSAHVTDDTVPPETLQLNIDAVETENSNMGFKLNVVSIPADGIEVVIGGTCYVLKPDASFIQQ